MISVCIATYNGEKYIKDQILSILHQLNADDEVIISDDASSDATLDVIRSLGDPRIHITHNPERLGYTRNFENALRESKGDIIFLSDQDDVWMDNKVSTVMEAMQHADLVVCDAIVADENLKTIHPSFYSIRKPRKTFCGNVLKFGYLGCCMAFRKEVLDASIPFPADSKLCTHDNWIFLVASAFFRVKILDDKLMFYRRHKGTISSGTKNAKRCAVFRIHYRLYLLWNIIIRAKHSYMSR